jgi:histidinol-phosphatase (PHP family)
MKTTKDVMTYAKSAMQGMATGYFAYLAHPDLFFVNDFKVDRQLKKAVDYLLNESTKRNYILEWNANGLRRLTTSYPNAYFWEEVAKTNIPVIIGADCHSVDNLYDWAMEISEKKAKEMGLHVIDHLEIK